MPRRPDGEALERLARALQAVAVVAMMRRRGRDEVPQYMRFDGLPSDEQEGWRVLARYVVDGGPRIALMD